MRSFRDCCRLAISSSMPPGNFSGIHFSKGAKYPRENKNISAKKFSTETLAGAPGFEPGDGGIKIRRLSLINQRTFQKTRRIRPLFHQRLRCNFEMLARSLRPLSWGRGSIPSSSLPCLPPKAPQRPSDQGGELGGSGASPRRSAGTRSPAGSETHLARVHARRRLRLARREAPENGSRDLRQL
jgi:hypothetical protein